MSPNPIVARVVNEKYVAPENVQGFPAKEV